MKFHLEVSPHDGSQLELTIPQCGFEVGDRIPFELWHTGSIFISTLWMRLKQSTIYAKVKGKKVDKKLGGLKERTYCHKIDEAYIIGSLVKVIGTFKLPSNLVPTMGYSEKPWQLGSSEMIYGIHHTLTICVNHDEIPEFSGIKVDFPIIVKILNETTRPSRIVQLSSQTQVNNLTASEDSILPTPATLQVNEAGKGIATLGQMTDCPRYSMLSLPITGSSRSTSVETLPPHYDDLDKNDCVNPQLV